jgi:REP element-mobilizing transposase RayT
MNRQGREPRIHKPNTMHHVMIRGNNRQRIFFSNDDFEYFLKLLKETSEKFDHKIVLYCLMNNHAHLLVYVRESPLSAIMQKINFRYAKWLNRKRKRIGHLFQGRFRSLEVGTDDYFINLCRYIHLNPVEAKIVSDPAEYLWSSHHHYIENNYPEWLDSTLMLMVIKKKTCLDYAYFMLQPIDRQSWAPALFISESGEIVHNDAMLKILKKEAGVTTSSKRQFLSEEQVTKIVCNQLGISKFQLLGSAKNHRSAKQRILLINYLIQYADKKIIEMEKVFGKTHGTLSRQLKKFSEMPKKYFTSALLLDIEHALNQEIKNILDEFE